MTGPGRKDRAAWVNVVRVARSSRPGGVLGSILRQIPVPALCAGSDHPRARRLAGGLRSARLHGHAAEPARSGRGSRFGTSPAGRYVGHRRKRRPSPLKPDRRPVPSRRGDG